MRTGHNTTDRVVIDSINETLANRGRSLDGRPILRIVWSTDQTEKRLGTFREYYMKTVFLREYKGVKEVPKYQYCPDRWVLERLTYLDPLNSTVLKELVEASRGTYEPIFVFQDSNFNPLPVIWDVVERTLYLMENGTPRKSNDADAYEDWEKFLRDETAYYEAELDDAGRSALFAFENSVFLDSTKRMVK